MIHKTTLLFGEWYRFYDFNCTNKQLLIFAKIILSEAGCRLAKRLACLFELYQCLTSLLPINKPMERLLKDLFRYVLAL
jgi:hypothetical protein